MKNAYQEKGELITYLAIAEAEYYAIRTDKSNAPLDIITAYCNKNGVQWQKIQIINVKHVKATAPRYIIQAFVQ